MSEVLEFARILRREWVAAADSPTGALARALDAAIAEYESTRSQMGWQAGLHNSATEANSHPAPSLEALLRDYDSTCANFPGRPEQKDRVIDALRYALAASQAEVERLRDIISPGDAAAYEERMARVQERLDAAESTLARLREPLTVADASNLVQLFSRTAVGQQLAPTRQEVNAMRAVVGEFLRVRGVQP